ncbi:hypothetical protein BBP40_011818 [Aspergillus hancockii]|nr:hypothetical protein BBP40_011818 [Aspergillus hancockii]
MFRQACAGVRLATMLLSHVVQAGAPHVRDYFNVGGEYVTPAEGTFYHNQIISSINRTETWSGRHGFLDHGYEVYLLDRTLTGRSPIFPGDELEASAFSAEFIAQRFTAVKKYPKWPQARLHTQWPGATPSSTPTTKAPSNQSIIITHSQGGLYGWSWADAGPGKIKALIQIEPKGPPFNEVIFSDELARPWGLASIPLTYEPAPANLTFPPEEPARKLLNLARVPILVETGEASYHAMYDHCLIMFLRQAGVPAEHLELGRVGIHGNAHLQFMEGNSDEIAAALHRWIVGKVYGARW